jgi:plastocyanin
MRIQALLTAGLLFAFAACSGAYGAGLTSPGSGVAGGGTGYGSGTGGTGTGGNTGGTPASGDVAVIVGNNFMRSGHNGSVNPAVDTVAAGGSVTWTWTNTGGVPHGIQSVGSPIFRNGTVLTGNGSTYRVTFNTAGTYQYDCLVHGALMSGTIVVQ